MSVEISLRKHKSQLHYLRVDEGPERLIQSLHASADVDGTRLSKAALATEHSACLKLGTYLRDQLGLGETPPEELVISTADPDVLSLPWSWLTDSDRQWFVPKGLVVRCRHPDAPAERHFSREPSILVMHPQSGNNAPLDADRWELWAESCKLTPGLRFLQRPADLPHVLGSHIDIAYLPLKNERPTETHLPLVSYPMAWTALEKALTRSPPQMLLVGGPGATELRFTPWLELLARLVPTLVVMPEPEEVQHGTPLSPARMFVQQLHSEGGTPAQVCMKMVPPDRPWLAPMCVGGSLPVQRHQPIRLDKDWELELDRTRPINDLAGVLGELKDQRGGAIVSVWHGPTTAGLKRLHGRIEKLLAKKNLPAHQVGIPWPKRSNPAEKDFEGAYREALKLSSFDDETVKAALRNLAPSVTESAVPVLYLEHGVLAESYYPDRVDATIIERYLRWWMNHFASKRPASLILMLGLAVTTGHDEKTWATTELHSILTKTLRSRRPPGVELANLGRLGDVDEGDIIEFIRKYLPEAVSDPDDQEKLAEVIKRRTGGVYERVILELQQVDYYWSDLLKTWQPSDSTTPRS